MFGTKTFRLFGLLFLLMLALRIGYKYYRHQQPSTTQEHMANAEARKQALLKAIAADQQAQWANGATVILADSALATATTGTAQ